MVGESLLWFGLTLVDVGVMEQYVVKHPISKYLNQLTLYNCAAQSIKFRSVSVKDVMN